MVLALDAIVNLAAEIQLPDRGRLVGHAVAAQCLFTDFADADAFDPRRRAGEIAVDQFVIESDRFENLRAAIGLDRGDAHLRENLEQAFVNGFDELAFRGRCIQPFGEIAVTLQVHQRLEHQVGIHRPGSETDQAGEVMDIARLAGFHRQADFGSRAFPHQVMVHRRDAEQTRNRGVVRIDPAVAEDEELVSFTNRLRGLAAEIVHRRAQPFRAFGDAEQHLQRLALEIGVVNLADLLQIGVRQDRLLHPDAPAGLRMFIHQIGLGPDAGRERHHEFFADRIDRRIRDLRKQLLEVFEQQLRSIRQHRQRRVRAHRRDRFLPFHHHRGDDHLQFFDGVAERLLALPDRGMIRLRHVDRVR